MAQSVLAMPDYSVFYDNTQLQTQPGVIVANTVNAYIDVNENLHNLVLGASSNVVVEAVYGIDTIIDPTQQVRFFNHIPGLAYADPYQFLTVEYNGIVNQTQINATTNPLYISGGDENLTTTISATVMTYENNNQVFAVDDINENSFEFRNSVIFQSNVSMNKNILIDGELTVTSNVLFNSNLTVNYDLRGESNFDLLGNAWVGSNVTVIGDVYAQSNVAITLDLYSYSNVHITGELDVGSNALFSSNLTVVKNITGQSNFTLTGQAYIGSNMTVVGTTTLQSNLDVALNVVAHSNLYLTGRLEVGSNTLLNSNLTVVKNITGQGNFTLVGEASVGSTMSVTGALTALDTFDLTGNAVMQSTLTVAGDTALQSQLTVTNDILGQGDLTISGNAQLNSSLGVTTDISANRNIRAAGNMFSMTMNLYKNLPTNVENKTQVAYAMFINAYDQLELIKFEKFQNPDTNAVETHQKRMAIWGGDTNYDADSLTNYQVLNEYNSVVPTTTTTANSIGYTYGFTNNVAGGGGASGEELISLSNFVITALKKTGTLIHTDPASNVAIGTNVRQNAARLTVNGAVTATSYCNLILDDDTWDDNKRYVPSLSNFNWLRSVAIDTSNMLYGGNATGMGAFELGTTPNSLMIIGSNIGLGLNNPASVLHVAGTTTTERISLSNTTGEVVFTQLNNKIGIANANPAYTLHVTGQIYASQDVIAFSDCNYKTNFEVITTPLSKLSQISGYTFNKTDPTDTRRYAGVLAQELEQVLPEVVYSEDNKLSVAYGNIAALLIEAVKELKQRVEVLEAAA